MKFIRITFASLCFILSAFTSSAQMNEDIAPASFSYSSTYFAAPSVTTLVFDQVDVAAMDSRDDKLGHMPRFARSMPADISLANAGTWATLPDGDRIWRCRISSAGALALIPCYDAFYLPQGATLHIYTPQKTEVLGAFTAANNPADGRYNTGLIHGSECIFEYYEPRAVSGQGRLHINEVGYAYRMVPAAKASRDLGDAATCEVNVACPEGDYWEDQKNAAVRILVKFGGTYGWCSGTLMNNVSQDCTPYILSADHCYQDENNNYTPASAADLNQWIFYFNYQSPTCSNPSSEGTLGHHLITGCTVRAASQDNGGALGSDFVLVRANNNVPLSYAPYYAGWSRSTAPAHAGVSIHHPSGDIAKISTYSSTLVSSHWGFTTIGTHWQVGWVATADGYGVTEPGSSGSPIFDFSRRVVGTLTGGGSSCSNTNLKDSYGKMSYHWSSNGISSAYRLSDWLDPSGTGALVLDGIYAPCSPVLAFDAGIRSVQQAGSVCDNNLAVSATLTNYGTQILNEDSFTFIVDGGSPQAFIWTGALNTLQSEVVSLPVQNFPAGTHTLSIRSSMPNGSIDGNPANDLKTTTFTVYSAAHHYTYTLHTGDRGSEVSWELLNANNGLVYAGGPYTNVAGGQTLTQDWCLAPGCYSFHIFNSAGHGLTGNSVNGSYTIADNGGAIIAQNVNVAFGSEEVINNICISSAAGIHEDASLLAAISVYPNPSTGLFTISNGARATSLAITDALGRLIRVIDLHGDLLSQVDLRTEDSGIYFFRFASDQGTATRKVVLSSGK